MRALFTRWGLPGQVRVDNGWPWAGPGDLPAPLALWLVGLGVGVLRNRPRRPQQNGMVERFHGLVRPWAEPATCPDFAAWAARLDWLARTQRERYPAVAGATRLAAYPALAAPVRPYDPCAERATWDRQRVAAYLVTGLWPRRVDKVGRITLYHRAFSVGRAHAGRTVYVSFDPQEWAWVVRDQASTELRRRAADEITDDRICALDLHPADQETKLDDSSPTNLYGP